MARESSAVIEEAAAEPKRPGTRSITLSGVFASLAYRNFLLLWLGQVTHSGALWMDMVGRPLLVLSITDSPIHLGLVMAVRTVPAVVLGPLAGVMADSFNRRTVLLATKVTVFFLGSVFVLVLLAGWLELWHIYAFTFLRGATMAFDQPARRAMVPSIVPAHLVTNALALSAGSIQAMRILGAGGAGLIIAFAGVNAVFVTMAVAYGAAVVLTWMLRTPDHERAGFRGVSNVGVDMLEGFKFAWNEPAIRGIIITSAAYYTFGMAFMTVFAPLMARNVLGIGDSGFGYMMAMAGVGGIIGAISLAAINPSTHRGLITIAVLTAIGALLVLFSASTYLGPVALTFSVVMLLGGAMSWVLPLVNSVLLDATPENMRGRVLGLLSFDRAMATMGAAVAGLAAAFLGVQVAQIIFGAACAITAIAMVTLYPAIRRIE